MKINIIDERAKTNICMYSNLNHILIYIDYVFVFKVLFFHEFMA